MLVTPKANKSPDLIKVLIVEDEFLIATDLEETLAELGFAPGGIACCFQTAIKLAEGRPDVALVDLNLRDGPTGQRIASRLVNEFGVAVIFITANPRQLEGDLAGALGVVSKPCAYEQIGPVIHYAARLRRGDQAARPGVLMAA